MTKLKLSLYENAIDSINHAIEHYTSDPDLARRYKYTILHLSQGINLLLKERLSMEHPNFIYKNVAKPDGNTIDVFTTIERLEGVAGIDLGYAKEVILNLAKQRNQIEHFEVSLTKQQIDSIIGRTVPFLVAFVNDVLKRNFDLGDSQLKTLLDIREYHQNAIKAAKSMLRDKNVEGVRCDKCQDITAIRTNSYHTTTAFGTSGLNFYSVQCLACLELIEHGILCQECGRENPMPESQTIPAFFSYCQDCRQDIVNEFDLFSDSRYALFAAEVRRWMKEYGKAEYIELMYLVSNVASAGSSTPNYIYMLYANGIIDFYYAEQRTIHEAKVSSGVDPVWTHFNRNDIFKWTWKLDH